MSDVRPTIYQLTDELNGMSDWYTLGVTLRVDPNKLQEIQKSSPQEGIQRWRIDMLQYWLSSTPDASWSDIIVALEKIGHHTLAATLREKYHVPQVTGQQQSPVTVSLNTTQVAATQAIVPVKYRRDFEDIQDAFAQLFDEVAEILENEESVTVERLKRFVSRIPDMKDSLDNAHTISDIIDIIQEHSSLTSCTHLKGVAERFNIVPVIEKIEKYYQIVSEFCENKLTHHIYMKPFLDAKSSCFTPSTTITFKLRWSPSDRTLSDILELIQQAFDEQSIYVHIVVVRGGSVQVICCAPQYLMTELVRLAQKNRELLVESSVTYLRVGDTIVVDTSDQNEISLVKDLVLQLTTALQLKDPEHWLSGPDSQAAEDVMKSMTHSSASEPSSSIWQITFNEAEYILTYKPDGTFLVREMSGKPATDFSLSSINTHEVCVVVNGRVEHIGIYKKGQYYGPYNNEKYTSIEQCVAVLLGGRFTLDQGMISGTLTNQLFPDKDTIANLPSDIPTIRRFYTFKDVASLPKHYPHHDESTWLCRPLSKENSERLLRERIDETFLVRATNLSGPTHLFTVDIMVQRQVVSLSVYREGDWLRLERVRERYDSINTLVMLHAVTSVPIPVGDHKVQTRFRYPVHSSKQ